MLSAFKWTRLNGCGLSSVNDVCVRVLHPQPRRHVVESHGNARGLERANAQARRLPHSAFRVQVAGDIDAQRLSSSRTPDFDRLRRRLFESSDGHRDAAKRRAAGGAAPSRTRQLKLGLNAGEGPARLERVSQQIDLPSSSALISGFASRCRHRVIPARQSRGSARRATPQSRPESIIVPGVMTISDSPRGCAVRRLNPFGACADGVADARQHREGVMVRLGIRKRYEPASIDRIEICADRDSRTMSHRSGRPERVAA